MMADKQYSVISEAVYWLDPKHRDYDHTYKENFIKKLVVIILKSYKSKTHWTACRRWL
nr:hypothetical protein [Enterococcus faecium]